MKGKFRDSFEKSPIGIIFFDKMGNLTEANKSALKIGGFTSLNEVLGINIVNAVDFGSKREELFENGYINIQVHVDFDNIKKAGIYNPKRSGIAFIDLIISVIDSGFLVQIQDITESKKDEIDLKIKEEQLMLSLEAASAGMWIRDPVGEWKATAQLNPLFGRSIDDPSLDEEEFMNYIHPEDLPRLIGAWKLAIKGEEHYDQEYRVIWSDGSVHWLASKGQIVLENDIPRFIGITYDITEPKKTEEELKAIRDNLELKVQKRTEELENAFAEISDLYNNAPCGYHSLDKDSYFVKINDTELKWLGYSREEIIGKKKFIDLITEDSIKTFQENYHGFVERGYVTDLEFEMIRNDGNILPVLVNATAIKDADGNFVMSRSTLFDITERIKMENVLKESEEKYRELFNNVNDMISLSEIKVNGMPGKYIEVNEVAVKRLGYSKEEFLNLGPMDIVAPECRSEIPNNAVEMAEKGNINVEIVHVTKNGKRIPVEVNGHVIRYKGKNAYLTVSRDITERKNTEETLQEIIQELERSNAELQQFAYVSSHDLQEPLRTIASFTQLLEYRYKGKFDSDADEFMDYIVEAAVRMKQQIQDLLDYSRVATKGKDFELVNMNNILNRTIQSLQASLEESNAQITYDSLPDVSGDAGQLERVFNNLISNAIKFKKVDNPLKIHISGYKSEDGKEYIFSIGDNGIGIEEQYKERIFTIFQRLHTREEYEGTGIGLSIVKRIIERHGGRVWVESKFGVGSVFYFTIPYE